MTAVLTFTKAQNKARDTTYKGIACVCSDNFQCSVAPLHLFKRSSCSWMLLLGTLGLPDNFEDTGGAVFTSFQTRLSVICHLPMEDGNYHTVTLHYVAATKQLNSS